MPRVRYITSLADIPADQKYVLVKFGEEYGQTKKALGLVMTVARQ